MKQAIMETTSFVEQLEGNILPTYSKETIIHTHCRTIELSNVLTKAFPLEKNSLEYFISSTLLEFKELCETRKEKQYRPPHARFDDKAVINLTKTEIPEDLLMAFSFGPKFCFPAENNLINTITFLDNIDEAINWAFPIETSNEAYKQVSIEMTKERMNKNILTRDVWLDLLRHRIIKFNKRNPDLYFLRSDKGKHTVIINKEMYTEKLNGLVLTNDYIPITSINRNLLEQRNNMFVDELIKAGAIEKSSRWAYTDSCTLPARIYGLIKIHKNNHPMRPIVSACGSPGFRLAKLITDILSDVFNEKGFHIKDSFELIDSIKDLSILDEEIMISFDVSSMFTSIPIDHMIHLIKTRQNLIYSRYKVNFKLLNEILVFLLVDCAVFTWNGDAFKQRDSLAMGSPLSPILARILMTHLISTTLPSLKFIPKLIALYVDDSFWIVDKNEVNNILTKLNNYHPRIKFTVERETNECINFLDITIIREEGKIITNWYRKPFASLRILNYFSHHEKSCIIETASAFIRRIMLLSDGKFFLKNKEIVEEMLWKNSFPETEIITLINDIYTFMKPQIKKSKYTGQYVPIKYRGKLTSQIKLKLSPFLDNGRLVGIPDRCSSKHFSVVKDKIELKEKTNIILMIRCQCKAGIIIRHTDYHCTASNLLDDFHAKYNTSKGKCLPDNHKYNRLHALQCKYFGSMKNIYNMLTYSLKNELIDTNIGLPNFYISKHLIHAKLNDEIQSIAKL